MTPNERYEKAVKTYRTCRQNKVNSYEEMAKFQAARDELNEAYRDLMQGVVYADDATPKERYRAAIQAYYCILDANDYTSDKYQAAYSEVLDAEAEFFAWAGIDKLAIGCPRR